MRRDLSGGPGRLVPALLILSASLLNSAGTRIPSAAQPSPWCRLGDLAELAKEFPASCNAHGRPVPTLTHPPKWKFPPPPPALLGSAFPVQKPPSELRLSGVLPGCDSSTLSPLR